MLRKMRSGNTPGLDAHSVDLAEDAVRAANARERKVDEDPREPDGQEKRRLVLLVDREPDEEAADGDHHELAPREVGNARRLQDVLEHGVDVHGLHRTRARVCPAFT